MSACAPCGRTVALVKVLHAAQVSTTHTDSRRMSVLHYACTRTDTAQVAQYVLDHMGGDVHTCARNGTTALHSAAQAGCMHVVALLLRRGAVPSVLNSTLQTPLYLAALHGLAMLAHTHVLHSPSCRPHRPRGSGYVFAAGWVRAVLCCVSVWL